MNAPLLIFFIYVYIKVLFLMTITHNKQRDKMRCYFVSLVKLEVSCR